MGIETGIAISLEILSCQWMLMVCILQLSITTNETHDQIFFRPKSITLSFIESLADDITSDPVKLGYQRTFFREAISDD
jgi:hypothetical protein